MHLCIFIIFFVIAILLFLSKFIIFALQIILFIAIFVLSINAISDFFKKEKFFRCNKSMSNSTLLYKETIKTIIFCFLECERKHYLMRKIILTKKFFSFLSFVINL